MIDLRSLRDFVVIVVDSLLALLLCGRCEEV